MEYRFPGYESTLMEYLPGKMFQLIKFWNDEGRLSGKNKIRIAGVAVDKQAV